MSEELRICRRVFDDWFLNNAKAQLDPWHKEFAWSVWQAARNTSATEQPNECEVCEGYGVVATTKSDLDGFPVEAACPKCNSPETNDSRLQRIKDFLKLRYGRDMGDVHDDMAFLVEQLEKQQWQPIETAPGSNGSVSFLAYIQGHGPCVCFKYLGKIINNSSSWFKPISRATHWMPLPKPPSA